MSPPSPSPPSFLPAWLPWGWRSHGHSTLLTWRTALLAVTSLAVTRGGGVASMLWLLLRLRQVLLLRVCALLLVCLCVLPLLCVLMVLLLLLLLCVPCELLLPCSHCSTTHSSTPTATTATTACAANRLVPCLLVLQRQGSSCRLSFPEPSRFPSLLLLLRFGRHLCV